MEYHRPTHFECSGILIQIKQLTPFFQVTKIKKKQGIQVKQINLQEFNEEKSIRMTYVNIYPDQTRFSDFRVNETFASSVL